MSIFVIRKVSGIYFEWHETMRGATNLDLAKRFVHRRAGKELEWTEHNSHGRSWEALDVYRINNGPQQKIQYYIEEIDVISEL